MKFSTKQNDPQALLAETKKAADHLFTVRGTISRVMSRTAIYPGCLLPGSSSDLPETDGPPYVSFAVLLRMGFTYAPPVTGRAVVSCTALPPLPAGCVPMAQSRHGGSFLLHCPWSHLRRTLSGILPCEARTFLSRTLSSVRQRPSVPLTNSGLYHMERIMSCQLIDQSTRLR